MITALAALVLLGSPDAAYKKEIGVWRQEVEKDLTRPQGWLSLVGLYWLKEGETTVGSDPKSGVVLPASIPKELGTISLKEDSVILHPIPGVPIQVANGDKIAASTAGEFHMESDETFVSLGTVTFTVIKRGARTGIRIWDSAGKGRTDFKGCKWYPVNDVYRIEADYTPYPVPKSILITNVLGDSAPVPNPGYVSFTLNGKKCRLEAQAMGDAFFFNFKDSTTGNETYPAGRFLNAPPAKNGKVVLDFNRATNPPCAFTTFATCPLPPAANRLDVAIRAGEKAHHPNGE